MKYVEDFSAGQVKGIGAIEILGVIGLIAPAFVDSVDPGGPRRPPPASP